MYSRDTTSCPCCVSLRCVGRMWHSTSRWWDEKYARPRAGSDPSYDSAIGDTIVVKTGSSSASDVSSLRSSPDENIPSATSQTPSSVYSASNGGDSRKRKRSGTNVVGSSSPQRQYDYSPPKRTEHSQHVVDRPLHALGNADGQQDNNYHNGANH